MEPLPESFKAAVRGAWPAAGPPFLAALPELIREFEIRWDIRALAPFPLSYNYVAPALRTDGAEVVLKLGVPNPELTAEAEALRLYAGRGAAILLAADPARGALLLERVRPGEPLATVADDDAATLIAAGAMAKLWRPLLRSIPSRTCGGGRARCDSMRSARGTNPARCRRAMSNAPARL